MFVVEDVPRSGPTGQTKRMIDVERDAWLQLVRGGGPEGYSVFKLVWGGRVIPFNASMGSGPPSGFKTERDSHLHWTIDPVGATGRFGRSLIAELEGIKEYIFFSEREREEALRLAIEALLEFGFSYSGRKWDHSRSVTVEYDGALYQKADFLDQ